MMTTKLKLAAAAAVVFAVSGVGLVALSKDPPPPPATAKPAPPPVQQPAATPVAKVDAFGDPLPKGAVLRLGTVRYRIPDVAAVGFRPNGEIVALAKDYSLHVFPRDGSPKPKITQVVTLKTNDPSSGEAMSANAKYVAGTLEHKAVVWDVSGDVAKEHTTLVVQDGARKVFSPDGEWLLIEDTSNNKPEKPRTDFHLCHLPTKEWRQLQLPEYWHWSTEFAADGKFFVAACNKTVFVVDSKTAQVRSTFKRQRYAGVATLSPDGSILALSGRSTTSEDRPPIRFFSTTDGKELQEWKGPAEEHVSWLRYTPDGKHLLVGWENTFWEWDPLAGKPVRDIPGPTDLGAPVFSPDGKMMAMRSEDAIGLWNLAEQKAIHPEYIEAGHVRKVFQVTVSPDGKTIVTLTMDGDVRLWSAEDGKPTGHAKCPIQVGPVPFLPDSSGFILLDPDYLTTVLHDTRTGKELRRFTVPAEFAEFAKGDYNGHRLSIDGKTLFTYTSKREEGENGNWKDHEMKWDVATGKLLDRKEVANDPKRDLNYRRRFIDSPDGQWEYGSGLLTNNVSKETIQVIPKEETYLLTGRFSPNSQLLFAPKEPNRKKSYENRGSLVVFDMKTKKPVAELDTGLAIRVAASPDGKYLAVMNLAELVVWDLASKRAIHRFPAKRMLNFGWEDAIAWTPDGRRVILAEDDGTALLWEVAGP